MNDLRTAILRLAHEVPETRTHLVPILRKTAAEPKYEDYVKDKRKKHEEPLKKEEWESKVLGKGKGKDDLDTGHFSENSEKLLKQTDPKKFYKLLNPKQRKHYDQTREDVEYLKKSPGESGDIMRKHDSDERAMKSTMKMIKDDIERRDNIQSLRRTQDKSKAKPDADSYADRLVDKIKSEGKPKKKEDPFSRDSLRKMKERIEKSKPVKAIVDKHDMKDSDLGEVEGFQKNAPKAKKDPAQMLADFMAKAKPETKKRMKDITPEEFMKIFGAIMSAKGESEEQLILG